MQFLLIFTLMLAAESLVIKNGEGEKKQQKRRNTGIVSGSVSARPVKSLSSEEHNSYVKYGLGSKIIGLGPESIYHGNAGVSSATTGLRSNGLSSGGYESSLRPGKTTVITVRGPEHGSGLGGIDLGAGGYILESGSFKGAGFSGDLRGGASAAGDAEVTTVTHQEPVHVPQPVPVTVNRPVTAPYLVEVPRPVQVFIPLPVGGTVNRPYPVTFTHPVPVPQPLTTSVPHANVIAIPQSVPPQVPQPLAVPVPRPVVVTLPYPVLVPSVIENDGGGLEPFAGGVYSSGITYSSSVASINGNDHSGDAGGLEYSSGGNFAYKSNYGSSGLHVGQVSTPLKGVYVPSYLGGLHGLYRGPNSNQGSGYVEGYSRGADYADRSPKRPGH